MSILIYGIAVMLWFVIVGWLTSDKSMAPWIKDDERVTVIKYKTIVQSWSTVFLFCISTSLTKRLGMSAEQWPYLQNPIASVLKEYVQIQILVLLVVTYVLFYIVNSRKLNA
ncbi:phosphoglycerate mutase [Bacillus sp. CGMCC 1.60114]|uniref:phosphoglycerate mutase n=1 Tax=unclassified Bacillus (in: firmicutes) TaxID=185979 RepID=UPI00363C713C